MILSHVALASSSEESADRFFGGLLGLKKSEPKILPAAYPKPFSRSARSSGSSTMRMTAVHFEIFIFPAAGPSVRPGQSSTSALKSTASKVSSKTAVAWACSSSGSQRATLS